MTHIPVVWTGDCRYAYIHTFVDESLISGGSHNDPLGHFYNSTTTLLI